MGWCEEGVVDVSPQEAVKADVGETFSVVGESLNAALANSFKGQTRHIVVCHDDDGEIVGSTFAWISAPGASRKSNNGAYYDLIEKTEQSGGPNAFLYSLAYSTKKNANL